MSSDDANDDSGFDKEAEREKLREKYGQDDDRENTRRMSELLLQGATMTGKHCGDCGDPIFRYDGQEFCPSCQHEVEGGRAKGGSPEDEQTSAEAGDPSTAGSSPEATERPSPKATDRPTAPDGDAERPDAERSGDERPDDEPRVEIEGVRVADGHVDRSNLRDPPSQQGGESGRSGSGESGRPEDSSRGRVRGGRGHRERVRDAGGNGRDRDAHGHERGHADDRGQRGEPAPGAGDLGPARESLVRTLTDLSRRAEDTDDATHARELLAATREAVEALAALDRADR